MQKNGALNRQTEELIHSEELFRNTFEYASVGMALGDPDGKFVRTNAAFDRMMGYKPGELIGVHRSVLTPPEDVVENEDRYRQFLETGLPRLSYEKRYVRKDGWVIWVDVNVSFVRDADGDAMFSIIMARDITEHKQMEIALRESEEKYHSLLEHAYDAIIIADFEGNLLEVNKKAEELLSCTKEELLGTNFSKLHPEEELGRVLPAFREMVEGKIHSLLDTNVLRKDGKTIPVDIVGGAVAYGGMQVAQAIFRDITERKRIEKHLKNYQKHLERLVDERTLELRNSEEKFRNIFEKAVVGIYQSTPEGRFLRVNPALAQMYGYERPEELVRSISNIATDIYADPERRKDFMDLAKKDGIVRNFELQIRTRDGSLKYVSVNAHTVKDGNGNILYYEGIIQDVTEKKLAIDQMMMQRDLAMKLAQIDRLEEGLAVILQTAINDSGMECGGVSLKNPETSSLELVFSIGLPNEFSQKIRHIQPGTSNSSRMMAGIVLHVCPSQELTSLAHEEGYKHISIVPILRKEEVIGTLFVASQVLKNIPDQARIGLEYLAAEIGSIVARMQTRQRLDDEISIRMQTDKALMTEHQSLQEANTALKVLLKHREDDKKDLEDRLIANVRLLILPYIQKLKASRLEPFQQMNVDFIDSNLNDIVSPFLNNLRVFNFTPRQIEVIALIKEGKTTKEIAQFLAVGKDAVDLQRLLIRKKLGINNKKSNLRSYLQSLI
jgi:PAS domain S-box-containing protein